MNPSPVHASPRAQKAARRWRFPVYAVLVSAALVISPLTVPAEADDKVPADSVTATPGPQATDPANPEATDEPGSVQTVEGSDVEDDAPAVTTPTEEPTEEPTEKPSGKARPGQTLVTGPAALAPLACNNVYALQGGGDRNLWSVNTGTGALTSVGTFEDVSGSGNLNGLGVTADGSKAFGIIANSFGTGRTVYVHDRAAETTTALGAGVAGAAITHGAVNPVTGIYYYGGVTTGGTTSDPTYTLNIYGFNPATSTSLGRVATGDITDEAAGGNGDWAFDTQGRLYFVAGDNDDNPILLLDQTVKDTPVTTPDTVTATELATSTAPAAINGLAFGGDGFLYISSSATVYKINPSSGATVSDAPLTGGTTSVDLASCAVPSTIEVVKDFPDGRAVTSDQATLSISGGGITTPVTATTAGADSGVQAEPAETAGPVLALNGTTYTISESGTGTAAASYDRSWVCRNTLSSATLASGTGASGTVTLPSGTTTVPVLCTFTNSLRQQDFGDAPAPYGTTSAASGPRHTLVGYDSAAKTAALMLGSRVDGETDGVPGALADADDTAGVDDEDALTSLTLAPGATTASATVPVINTTGSAATLYGWIDTNGNGTFQAGEAATASVPNGATSATLNWAGLAPVVDGGQPVVRLRLTSATLVDTAGTAALDERSQGPAPDGEVEDSLATVATALPDDCANPFVETFGAGTGRASLPAGQTTYNYAATGAVQDGSYALVPGINTSYGGWWHNGPDHTGDTNGRAMLVNASLTAGKFFSKTFTGLSVGSQYDFSAWITNANNAGSTILPNVSFRVVDPASGATLATANSGSISNKASLVWDRYALSFAATQPTVRLELVNNAPGGGGNDLAIDDIAVAPSCEHGDAPDSYGTRLSSNGPVHARGSALRLGAAVDYEGDGQPTSTASGDDSSATDDEDGAGPISVTRGSVPSITVTATNNGPAPATLAGWVDLDKSGTFDANERATATVPPLFPGGPITLTFSSPVTTSQATYARFRLYPGTVTDASPKGPADGGEVEDHPVTTLNPTLQVTKTSDATASSKPGDTVRYTVTVTNSGSGDFTAGNPARLLDDLTGVLDDGDYQDDAAATVDGAAVTAPAYAVPRISWSGPLAAGKSVVITYSVVLTGGGDGHVRNTAFVPPPGNPTPATPDCTQTSQPCATHSFELPKLTITKTSNRTQLPAVGQEIVYTVTVKNTGLGDYTAAHPATFADDLTAVLDDATLDQADVSATRGTATFTAPTLSWTGTLPAGESATISYTLTYTGAGDHQLDNSACVPVGEAADPTDACRTVSVPGSGLRHNKSVDPASGTAVRVGQVLTYTLTFENVGAAAATVDTSDDLSGVLDDAQLVGTPTAGAGLTANVAGNQLEIDGSVPAGETRTVSYQVQVRPHADQGDHVLRNLLACEPSEPAGCAPETTSNPVRHLTLDKTSNRTADSKPGDTVTYTVTVHNDGEGDWTATDPATVVDDLSGVLDDAGFDGTANASSGTTSYAAPRLTWTGALAHGDTVTITYGVVLAGGGDGHVDNVVWQPANPGNPGPTPDCSTATVPCADVSYDLPKLTIDKTSNRTRINADGDQITYTVTVTNPGPGHYTTGHPATFSDDLSDVLDDATFDTGSITATTGTATLNGTSLDWSGELAAGDSATITYTVTYDSTLGGDFVVDNSACVPQDEALDPADRCRTVKTPGSGLREKKQVDPASGTPVSEGQVLTYTLTFQNVGAAPATVDNSDDLSGVVDDATVAPGSVQADAGLTATLNGAGDRIAITGTVPVGATLTVTYQVTVKPYADQGDHVITNALGCEPLDVPCVPTSTSNPVRHLTITKTSDATADSKPGDTVSYTVRLVNDGEGDYTAASPASLVDDLTGVLDDATFNGVAHASQGPAPTYAAPRIAWSGPLAAGDEVRVTYEVVLKGGGDGDVDNVTWVPVDPTDPGPTPECGNTAQPCAEESFDLPKLVITKDADKAQVTATGQTVAYTIVVSNPGPGDYTDAHPATFVDNLTDVLDDAEIDAASISATSGSASLAGQLLGWSGALPAGQSAEITYTVTYRGTGDRELDNTACVPVAEARTVAEQCDTAQVVGSVLTHAKSVNPASGTSVSDGQVLTYTLTFDNPGTVPADVNTTDDLSGVLDDATLDAGSITAGPGLTATPSATGVTITGTVPAGQTRTVTYQVTVKPFAQQGDHVITNALACEPGEPVPCAPETTSNPVAHLVIDKSSDRTVDSKPGDTITYTVTATNDGPGDFTAADPATVVDDLTGVLDDATYGGQASANRGIDPTYAAPRLTWSGALVHDDTVTITYTVVLKGGGDGVVRNVAWQPADPGNPGPTPDCATSPRPCDTVSYDLPKLTVAKGANRSDLPATGQTVTYEVVVTNRGPGDYTAGHPATFSDDLSDVLDDATAGVVDATVGSASITGTTLSWSGVLTAGQWATITYTVTYRGTGDRVLDNTACVPAVEALVPAENCDTVSVPGSGLVHRKSVDPAPGTAVAVGDVLTYTLTFDNTAGQTAATVNTTDDLSEVLDDATFDDASITEGAGLDATRTGDSLAITGSVPAGATRTVTYQVAVKPFADQGDHVITNALQCEPGEPTPCAPEVVSNPVRHVVLTKVKTAPAAPDTGDQVTYTLTVHNDGTGDWTAADPASVVDDLTDVLDDATWDGNAMASAGSLSYAAPRLTWTGALAHGASETITYTVTVTNLGDHQLINTASVPGCQLPECTPAPVVTPMPHVVPSKASNPASGQGVQPGDLVTYTLEWLNDGQAPGVVDSTDDLSGVLDDAVVVDEPTSSSGAVSATRTGSTLRVVGPIGAGDTVTVTYRVRVKPSGQHGDNRLGNVLTQDTPQVDCTSTPCTPVPPPTTQHLVGDLDDWKTVDPSSGTSVKQGARLTYTLHFVNTGKAPVKVDRVDDLSGVLDDATLVSGPTTSSAALAASAPAAGRIAVTGSLAPGAGATVTYTVQVKKDGQRGDDRLGNYLLDPGQQPPASCSVGSPRADARADCTANQVGRTVFNLKLEKKVVSSTAVMPGDKVRYRLQVTNRGPDAAPGPIVLRDPLPAGLELMSAKGKGWDCKAKKASDQVVCTYDADLPADKKAPPVFVVAKVSAAADGRVVNVAKVSAVGDIVKSDNKGVAGVDVGAVPALPGTGFRFGGLW